MRAKGPGFLTPADVPPADERYAVSNAIGVRVEPVFKSKENEFRYTRLTPADGAALRALLAERGYRAGNATLAALAPHVGEGKALLLAEVDPAHVELVASNRVELGGIRWVTRTPPAALPVTLGLLHSPGTQDLTVYVLDRKRRYVVEGYETAFVPSNVAVEASAALQVGALYNALFDAFARRHPSAFVTEYAWSTAGCGQPCPDAPLAPDELLTLGGDVLEARTTSAKERSPDAPPETDRERAAFEAEQKERPAAQRAKAAKERARARREVERRRALMARQTYVLTRLHRRYDREGLPRDVSLVPAATAVSHGVGVPKGPSHAFTPLATPSKDEVQVRFVAFQPWQREMPCAETFRYRWGKRWESEARASRAVPVALDLLQKARDPRLLTDALAAPLSGLGLAPAKRLAPSPSAAPIASTQGTPARGSCGLPLGAPRSEPAWFFLALVLSEVVRRRRR